jgi:3-oxoacyl-[acyl-carrier protein] reductase
VSFALVTGAAGAIGSASCVRLAREGWDVVLVDVLPVDAAAERVRAEGVEARGCVADVRTPEGVEAIVAAASATGGVGLLVNNAGGGRWVHAPDVDEAGYREIVDLNLVAPLRLCELLAPLLAGGSIVNISSRAAFGAPDQIDYATAKAGLIGATRSLALHLAPATRVNAIAPGLIDTPRNAMPAEDLARIVRHFPLPRAGRSEEIADAVAYLAGASFVTGHVLDVCGGHSIGEALW